MISFSQVAIHNLLIFNIDAVYFFQNALSESFSLAQNSKATKNKPPRTSAKTDDPATLTGAAISSHSRATAERMAAG